jgi:hypothetical protein
VEHETLLPFSVTVSAPTFTRAAAGIPVVRRVGECAHAPHSPTDEDAHPANSLCQVLALDRLLGAAERAWGGGRGAGTPAR